MTGPDDSEDTRPISVAELLARSGSIGSPPVGGRRRRRRGKTDAVTVAELTGEIPIIHHEPSTTNGTTDTLEAEPEAEPAYEPETEAEAPPVGDAAPSEVPAEEMRPDPVDEDDLDAAIAIAEEEPAEELVDEEPAAGLFDQTAELDDADERELPPYLRAIPDSLFGGRSDVDELVRGRTTGRGTAVPEVPPETTTAEDLDDATPPTRMQQLVRGALIVLQSVLAVAFGAGLFIAFEQLWQWDSIIALVLSVLVILGLVVAVRIVRKTEDIASTLTAVAVGALVTFGPLALLQHH
jgi:hypothetical protein